MRDVQHGQARRQIPGGEQRGIGLELRPVALGVSRQFRDAEQFIQEIKQLGKQ